mmetsp:Transcript_121519/g.388775  ORF Transcript_121519/g.388775 Transcript_121519/m.388775 type:complete len:260 (-) Transcript_121519:21-800(-)
MARSRSPMSRRGPISVNHASAGVTALRGTEPGHCGAVASGSGPMQGLHASAGRGHVADLRAAGSARQEQLQHREVARPGGPVVGQKAAGAQKVGTGRTVPVGSAIRPLRQRQPDTPHIAGDGGAMKWGKTVDCTDEADAYVVGIQATRRVSPAIRQVHDVGGAHDASLQGQDSSAGSDLSRTHGLPARGSAMLAGPGVGGGGHVVARGPHEPELAPEDLCEPALLVAVEHGHGALAPDAEARAVQQHRTERRWELEVRA